MIASLWRTWYVAAAASPLGPAMVASDRFVPWFLRLGGRAAVFDDTEAIPESALISASLASASVGLNCRGRDQPPEADWASSAIRPAWSDGQNPPGVERAPGSAPMSWSLVAFSPPPRLKM